MRIPAAITALLVLIPTGAAAQWSVTAQVGLHADRVERPQRVLRDGSADVRFSSPGEAPTIGLRAAYWAMPHFGIDAGLALSQNRSWSGGSSAGRDLESGLSTRTIFTSAAALWRPLAPTAGLQVQLGLGPAAIFHSGSGESLLARQIDFGGVGTIGGRIALSRQIRLGVDVYNYRFTSRFLPGGFQRPNGSYPYPAGTKSRSEWVILPAVRLTF